MPCKYDVIPALILLTDGFSVALKWMKNNYNQKTKPNKMLVKLK